MKLSNIAWLISAFALPLHAFEIESKYITSADGAQIYAQAAGDKSQPHILLIHGLALSTAVFDGLFANDNFTSKAYVVGYDTRGHGRSTMPPTIEGHSSALYAADYAAVAEEFGLVKPLFVGWSLGGVVATDILEHITPNPLAGIVYLASFPVLSMLANFSTPSLTATIAGLGEKTNVTLSKATAVAFGEGLFSDPANVPFLTKTSLIGQTVLQPPAQVTFVTTRPQNSSNLVAAGRAGLPTLFLKGTDDKGMDDEKLLPVLEQWFTNFTVNYVEHGPHAVFYDNQTYVEEALIEFANSVNAGQ